MVSHIAPASIPRISPVPAGTERPFWSVMIPFYDRLEYLAKTIESVLEQDPGPEQMEIVVVDDCSPVDPTPLVQEIGKGRVRVFRRAQNGGLSAAFTTCIEQARGHWVHILHDDDLVLHGFYRHLRRGIESRPDVGAAFCRHVFIDPQGNWGNVSVLEQPFAGVLPNFGERITVGQTIQCASIVVKRASYEVLGSFRTDLPYCLDWDMWKRIAVAFPVWYEPLPLACYRLHSQSITGRMAKDNAIREDMLYGIELARSYFPPDVGDRLARRARETYATNQIKMARFPIEQGLWKQALSEVSGGVRTHRSIRVAAHVGLLGASTAWSLFSGLMGAAVRRTSRT